MKDIESVFFAVLKYIHGPLYFGLLLKNSFTVVSFFVL